MKPKDYIKAMTTGRWPPKPEEEMISPGTERAIMRLSEAVPMLAKSIESLTQVLKEAADSVASETKLQGDKDEVALTIALTPEEWCEVVNAVSVRSTQLQRHEAPGLDMSKRDIKAWIKQLDRAYNKMTAVLTKNHLTY